jgi:hypothetical protein
MPLPPLDRYTAPTPYKTLGIESTDADKVAIRNRYNELTRDLQEASLDVSERIARTEILKAAYKQLDAPPARVRVDFFLLDRDLGRKQCEALVAALPKPDADVGGVFKPRTIRVTHEALHDLLKVFFADVPKVGGVFPAAMDLGGADLPDFLAVRFDCLGEPLP